MKNRPNARAWIAFLLAGAGLACGGGGSTIPAPVTMQPIVPSLSGSNGCSAPDVALSPSATLVPVALSILVPTPDSQICAARGSELLYATGANGQIVAIDVSTPSPTEFELVSPGEVATLLASVNIVAAPKLSGIAVLDPATLLVIERTSNTILAISRTHTNRSAFYAGMPNTTPGFASGIAQGQSGVARFSFTKPSMLCPSGDGRVFVADPGNHAIRVVANGVVFTATGRGTPGFRDGTLDEALLDTPTGVTIACNNTLVVAEYGENGFGNRLRGVHIGAQGASIATPHGLVFTLLGDGTPATSGGPMESAQTDGPGSPFVTTGGEMYWMDEASGVLRRAAASGTCDCPLSSNCAFAAAFPEFAPGHVFSLSVTGAGRLFVLDATAGALAHVVP